MQQEDKIGMVTSKQSRLDTMLEFGVDGMNHCDDRTIWQSHDGIKYYRLCGADCNQEQLCS